MTAARAISICFLWVLLAAALPAATLDFYTIDVEGGKSVLIVSPSGESMLFDAGWPQRGNRESSVDRIVQAIKAAGLTKIDHLVISHYDLDHIGDVPGLASRIPVRHIYDHGDFEPAPAGPDPGAKAGFEAALQRFRAYDEVRRKVGHTVLRPGDSIPLRGVDVRVLTAGGQSIGKPVSGSGVPNPLCATTPQAALIPQDVEDNRSIGLLFTFGNFRLLDLADLEARSSRDLVCPANLIGTVDVYHVNVHGQFKGIAPELLGALHPTVAIMGNGATKGADKESWPIVRATPGLEDVWQIHYSVAAAEGGNPPPDMIANLQPSDEGKIIKISVESTGAFSFTNTRNGYHKAYKVRPH